MTHSIFLEIRFRPENASRNPVGAKTQCRVIECHNPEDAFSVNICGHQLLHLIDPINLLFCCELSNLHGYVSGNYCCRITVQVELSDIINCGYQKLRKRIFGNCRCGNRVGKWSQAQVVECTNLEMIFRFGL